MTKLKWSEWSIAGRKQQTAQHRQTGARRPVARQYTHLYTHNAGQRRRRSFFTCGGCWCQTLKPLLQQFDCKVCISRENVKTKERMSGCMKPGTKQKVRCWAQHHYESYTGNVEISKCRRCAPPGGQTGEGAPKPSVRSNRKVLISENDQIIVQIQAGNFWLWFQNTKRIAESPPSISCYFTGCD